MRVNAGLMGSLVLSVMEGVGGYFDIDAYDQAYAAEFAEYFEGKS